MAEFNLVKVIEKPLRLISLEKHLVLIGLLGLVMAVPDFATAVSDTGLARVIGVSAVTDQALTKRPDSTVGDYGYRFILDSAKTFRIRQLDSVNIKFPYGVIKFNDLRGGVDTTFVRISIGDSTSIGYCYPVCGNFYEKGYVLPSKTDSIVRISLRSIDTTGVGNFDLRIRSVTATFYTKPQDGGVRTLVSSDTNNIKVVFIKGNGTKVISNAKLAPISDGGKTATILRELVGGSFVAKGFLSRTEYQ